MSRFWPTAALFLVAAFSPAFALQGLVWPTPNRAFLEGQPLDKFIQPTASGEVVSGTFGCVRNDATRVHQGIDLFPLKRDAKGEPADPIFAVYPGTVVYTSSRPAYSSLGRYIIIEHQVDGVTFNTLYAHLAKVEVSVGQTVAAGTRIALMGHSASDGIPAERAHLHLEFSLRLSDDFQTWFRRQKFGSPNYHGNFNGFNFSRWDPLDFYRANVKDPATSPAAYLRAQPTALTAIVRTSTIPAFIRRNSGLLSSPIPAGGVQGWQIEFTTYGLPKLWTPLTTAPRTKLLLTRGPAQGQPCLPLYASKHRPGRTLKSTLELLFGARF